MIADCAPSVNPLPLATAGILRCKNRTTPKNSPQELKVPAAPKVFAGKRVAEGMRAAPNARYAHLATKLLKIALEISHSDLGAMLRAKGCVGMVVDSGLFLIPAEYYPSQFDRHRHEPVFSALAFDPNDQVVE